jgi:mannose-1-phosphate guanylyltransferase
MADLSIALHEEEDARQFGVATLDERCLITRFVEKSPEPPSRLVNAGVWIFESHLVNEIPAGAVRVEETLFPDLVASGRPVLGHRFEGQWADIGTPERYLRLVMELLDGGAAGLAPDVLLGTRARVSRSAAGPGCRLGPRAEVSGSVLWEGVEISPGARVADSILADGVFVGAGVRLEGCVVGSGARIVEGSVVPAGAVIEADAVVGGNNG